MSDMSVTTADRRIESLHPTAQKACRLFLDECEKAGVNIFITETYRSQARQNYLYAQGRTRPGQKVTWTLNSNHKSKLAWDIAVSPPRSLYDVATLNKAGAIARGLGITWGGDWRPTIDRPHFEVKTSWKAPAQTASDVKELQRLLNQVGYKLVVDGSHGPATTAAVKAFQKANNLAVDGSAGTLTMAKLKELNNPSKPVADNTPKQIPPKKEVDEMSKFMDEKLPPTQQSDAEKLFEQAFKDGNFSVNHAPRVKDMTRRQFYDLKLSLEIREKLNK